MPPPPLPPLFYVPPPEDEDEETVSIPCRRQIVRRRSSHLERWIEDQHRLSTTSEDTDAYISLNDDVPPVGTACHPYLAYPHLTTRYCSEDVYKQTLESFIVVDDDDVKHADAALEGERGAQEEEEKSRAGTPSPAIDISTPPKSRKYSGLLQAPSPLRNLNLGRSSRHSSSSTAISSVLESPASSSGLSHCQSQPGRLCTSSQGTAHKRGHSWGSIRLPGYRSSLDVTYRSWKFKSTNALGHFSSGTQTSLGSHPIDEDDIAPPRPSFSSTSSGARSNNTISTDAPVTPNDFPIGSVQTLPTYVSKYSSPPTPEFSVPATLAGQDVRRQAGQPKRLAHKASSIRAPFASKAPINNATLMAPTTTPQTMRFGTHVPDILATPTSKKRRKKLCITGLRSGEVQRFEAVKKWCQSFGELREITRVPNGDIYVHFRKAEVADTVSRLLKSKHCRLPLTRSRCAD
ncbi:hypothetical protein NEOLEDRAFT_41761 [Neolentinus lepideus HHB14362 ss-1]|uniref:Uncharacterized protein n=1 Tax=Neolentinus lepideus HHB14362 ss-1 TaxID=1314782 RepID=A0A165W9F6_9AGAM|nr:hypothetical protein NEOLEDRAFT_41761 [Neolentinus lepideus HHB14362 ss-1]